MDQNPKTTPRTLPHKSSETPVFGGFEPLRYISAQKPTIEEKAIVKKAFDCATVEKTTIEKFNELVTNRFNRSKYIYRPKNLDVKFITEQSYLHDGIIKKHISGVQTIGGTIAIRGDSEYSTFLDCDIDHPETQTNYFNNVLLRDYLGIEKPSFSFVNSENGRQHHLIYLDKSIPISLIHDLQTTIATDFRYIDGRPIEIKPTRAGVRFMFGGSYEMVNYYTLEPIAPQNHPAEIEIAYNLFMSGSVTVASSSDLRQNLKVYDQQQVIGLDYEVKTPTNNQYIKGKFWDNIKKLETIGLTSPGTRNKAQRKIVLACVHRGYTEQQTIGYIIQEWLPKFHKDYKKAIQTGNFTQIRAEIKSTYNWSIRTYDRNKSKRKQNSLTNDERQAICEYMTRLTTGDELKPKQKEKTLKLLLHIAELYKTVGNDHIVPISHNLFDTWGFRQRKPYFNAVAYLKEKNAIKPIFGRSYVKVCQRYSLEFLKNCTQNIEV